MKLMKRDLKPNERIITYFMLESTEIRKSKIGQDFLTLKLSDRTGRVSGYLWNEPIITASKLTEKTFVKVQGITKMNNSLFIEIEKIREAERDEIDLGDFLEVVSGGIDFWYGKLIEATDYIRNAHCKRLLDLFFSDNTFIELFKTSIGGISAHHNYIGGLMEHTVNTMVQSAFTAERNPALLDINLLVTGAFLHDIGKTRELQWVITKEYTTEGKLLGHIGIGLLMLEEKLSLIKDFPQDLSILLKHMIISHHGEHEHGSPVKPSTPEAIVLNIIESADAKINHLHCHLLKSDQYKHWSPYDKILNTEIYLKKITSIKDMREISISDELIKIPNIEKGSLGIKDLVDVYKESVALEEIR